MFWLDFPNTGFKLGNFDFPYFILIALLTVLVSFSVDSFGVFLCWQFWYLSLLTVLVSFPVDSFGIFLCWQFWYLSLLTVLGGCAGGAPAIPAGDRLCPCGAATDDPPLPELPPPGQEWAGTGAPLCSPHTNQPRGRPGLLPLLTALHGRPANRWDTYLWEWDTVESF